jgi:hypothetical protein
MASLFKHPKSQYWTACFRDENGIQRRISTKETNRKKALKIASAYEAASREKRTLRQTQHVIDQLHHELTGHRVSRTSLRNLSTRGWPSRSPRPQREPTSFTPKRLRLAH